VRLLWDSPPSQQPPVTCTEMRASGSSTGGEMKGGNMKSLDLDKIEGSLGGSVASEMRRMEQGRASWMRAMTHSHRLA